MKTSLILCKVYESIMICLLVLALTFAISDLAEVHVNIWICSLWGMGLSGFFAFVDNCKAVTKKQIYIVSIAIFIALALALALNFENSILMGMVLVGLLFSVSKLLWNRKKAMWFYSGLLLAGIIFCGLKEIQHIPLFSVLVVVCVFIYNLFGKKAGFVPVIIIILLVSLLGKPKRTPYDWAFVTKTVDKISMMVERIYTNIAFKVLGNDEAGEFSLAGYSGSSSFGQGVGENDEVQLTITGAKPEGVTYLTGTVYNIYTENGWKKAFTDGEYDENSVALAEYIYAIEKSGLDKSEIDTFSKPCHLGITYENIKTNTVFSADNFLSYKQNKKESYQVVDENLRFDKIQAKGFSYNISFIETSLESDTYQEILKNSLTRNSEEICENKDWYNKLTLLGEEIYYVDLSEKIEEGDLKKKLENRQSYIFENYMSLPDDTSDEIADLAKQITAGCNTDYQKVAAIQNFLLSLQYNPNPKDGEGPMLENFLLKNRSGYCVHFASAMAVMARLVGVPSRYIEGFCVDYSYPISINQYQVTGNNAHAWCQVYLMGYGWLLVEATPGYEDNAYKDWESWVNNQEIDKEETEEYRGSYGDNMSTPATPTQGKPQIETRIKNKFVWGKIFKGTIIAMWGIIFATLFFLCIRLAWFRRMNVEKKYWYLFSRCLIKYEKKYGEKNPGETMREYMNRRNILDQEDNMKILANYEAIRYGKKCDEKDIKEYIEDICKKLSDLNKV